MRCINAGHTPPVLRRNGEHFCWLRPAPDLALGVMAGCSYREYEVELHAGDRLFWYTDGVTEAVDARNGLFGEERLLETLRGQEEASQEELLAAVKSAIDRFAGEAPQFDDITMLALDYWGPSQPCLAPEQQKEKE
jgi:serine phosphatase RsbU (regulator of sigma subunit)